MASKQVWLPPLVACRVIGAGGREAFGGRLAWYSVLRAVWECFFGDGGGGGHGYDAGRCRVVSGLVRS